MDKEKILFANIGWMTHYKGYSKQDKIVGGGSWNNEHKHEAFNFYPINGMCYGYVQPAKGGSINLNRISTDLKSDIISGVTVIWTATHPQSKGTYIVGWYKDAIVFSAFQDCKILERNKYKYNVIAKKDNCVLLPLDQRTFQVPRANSGNKGFLGQSNVWYADSSEIKVKNFKKEVYNYIQHYSNNSKHNSKTSMKVDVEARKMVEKAAIDYVTQYYRGNGYKIISREKDNVGWDLDAKKDGIYLKLEVKGLAGSKVSVRISQNEYQTMMRNQGCYILCVVINAIKKPDLIKFIWDESQSVWVSDIDQDIKMKIEEIPSYLAVVE